MKRLKAGDRVKVTNKISKLLGQKGKVLSRYPDGHYNVRLDNDTRFTQGLTFYRTELTRLKPKSGT